MRVHIEELNTCGGVEPIPVPAPGHHHTGPTIEGDGCAAVAGAGVVHGGHAVPLRGAQHQLHGGVLLAPAAHHQHTGALDRVTCHHTAVVTCGAGEAPLGHVLPTNEGPPGIKDLNGVDGLTKGVESSKGHNVTAHIKRGTALPGRGHLASRAGPLTSGEVIFIAAAGDITLTLGKQGPKGGGGEEGAGVVSRGAGVQRPGVEHREGVAAPLGHERGEGGDKGSPRHCVRPDIHHGYCRHWPVNIAACKSAFKHRNKY